MNAHENPFRSATVAELRYRLGAEERSGLVKRLRGYGWRACLLGPEGTGKTTLLEDLEATIRAAGREVCWIRLSHQSARAEKRDAASAIADLGPGIVALVDGGEVFGRLRWTLLLRTIRRSGAGVLATVHRPCGLPVLHRTRPDLDQALRLTRQLAGACWHPDLEHVARRAFAESRGNVREVFRAAYWHCAKGRWRGGNRFSFLADQTPFNQLVDQERDRDHTYTRHRLPE